MASQHWISVSTPHFEMYTTNSEKQAVRALQTFEQVRSYFLQRSGSTSQKSTEFKVRIIAFSSEKDFRPYRLNEGAFAYYLQSRERDYIVMQDIEADHSQAAVHEYTHLIVQHQHLDFPTWLNEGLADVYSSLEPRGQQAMVGRPLPGYLISLGQQRWLDWNTLLSVDHNSPYYNEREKMSIFYAQSWLLTHMLALGPAYNPGFPQFLREIIHGVPSTEAFTKVYGKSVSAIGKEAEQYIRQNSVKVALFDIKLEKADLSPQTVDLSALQSGLVLADLLASKRASMQQAKERLLALEAENPQSSEVEESLGYLAWRQNDTSAACRYFDLAVERGSKNAKLMVEDAQLSHQNGADPKKVIELLQKALALQPDQADARIFLAQIEASRGNYGRALTAVAPIRSIKPEQAYLVFTLQAFSHANLGDPKGARTAAELALRYAKSPADRNRIEQLLHALDTEKGTPVLPTPPAPQQVSDPANPTPPQTIH